MKSHLLLFFSILTLLFSIQKGSPFGNADMKQAILTKICGSSGQGIKKPCPKKCLRHQTHSEPRGDGNVVSDCGSPLYAIVTGSESGLSSTFYIVRTTIFADSRQPLSPYLETEHAPPRLP